MKTKGIRKKSNNKQANSAYFPTVTVIFGIGSAKCGKFTSARWDKKSPSQYIEQKIFVCNANRTDNVDAISDLLWQCHFLFGLHFICTLNVFLFFFQLIVSNGTPIIYSS